MSSWASALTTLGGAALGWLLGMRAAAFAQDRADALKRRNAAIALRVALGRMNQSLGPIGSRLKSLDTTIAPPAIHRWVEPLITELASADERVPANLLALEEELRAWTQALNRFRDLEANQEAAITDLVRLERQAEESGLGGVVLRVEAKHARERLHAMDPLIGDAADAFRRADGELRDHITVIQALLTDVVAAPLPTVLPIVDPVPPSAVDAEISRQQARKRLEREASA